MRKDDAIMYGEKVEPILKDIENKDIEIAGGSVVGIVLGVVNSLITYIANLTIGKKSYECFQDKIQEILEKADKLKVESLEAIDEDKEILETILKTYKSRKENVEPYYDACKKATEFCMHVLYIANETYKLAGEISKCGNKMLSSDFKICKYYALASVHSALENVYINLDSIKDEDYKLDIERKCKQILEDIKI